MSRCQTSILNLWKKPSIHFWLHSTLNALDQEYAAELVVNSTLNRQQILAVAPIRWVMEQMWLNRSNPQSTLADGAATESCNCLWLGAGGSGKT